MYQGRRRKSNRLKNFDYSKSGWYFVTICTQNKAKIFGELHEQKMVLNEGGRMVQKIWNEISKYYPGVDIDEFIIMPNHVHGIIIIDNTNEITSSPQIVGARFIAPADKGVINYAPTLGQIIRFLKGKSSFIIRQKYPHFSWQRNYYDHVIRNEKEYLEIKKYIYKNPLHWLDDENYM